jgi:predicted transcriptional regulator of viral defense system
MRYIDDVRKTFSSTKYPTFKLHDLKTLLSQRQLGKGYTKLMIHNLMKRGEIRRITRGIYSFHNEVRVVGFAYQPFYYGAEDALSILGISGQGTNPDVMTTRNVRTGVRSFGGRNYVVQRIRKEHFFGYSLIEMNDLWIPVADLEKAVIDMVYFDGSIRDELLPRIRERISKTRLNAYLRHYDLRTRKKVLSLLAH